MDSDVAQIIAVGIALAALAVWWQRRSLPRHPRYALPIVSISNAKSVEYDIIVIGAGPAGIAAAHTAHRKGFSVLVVEEGPLGIAKGPLATADLPAYTFEGTGSSVDSGNEWATLPLSGCMPAKRLSTVNASEEMSTAYAGLKLRYPRGHGIGGTSMIDWCQLFTSPLAGDASLVSRIATASDTSRRVAPFAVPKERGPLEWAFVRAVKTHFVSSNPSEEEGDPARWEESLLKAARDSPLPPQQGVFVTPVRLSCVDRTRVPIARAILGTRKGEVSRGISIVALASVTAILLDSSGSRATGVTVRVPKHKGVVNIALGGSVQVINGGKEMLLDLRCKKGIVVCAGAIHTPRLLRALNPGAVGPFPLNDVLGYPIVFRALPGLSSDPVNAHSWRSLVSWFLRGAGPAFIPVSTTAVLVDVPARKGAQLMIQLVPAGGFSRRRFAALGIALPLGVFKEGIILYVSLVRLPDEVASSQASLGVLRLRPETGHRSVQPLVEGCIAEGSARTALVDCLAFGMTTCRALLRQDPLSSFCDQEALDTTLFCSKEQDLVVRTLYQPSTKAQKLTPQQRAQGRDIASTLGDSPEYIRAYVAKHTRFLGYASGTATPFLEKGGSRKVIGVRNLVVGDASAVSLKEAQNSLLGVGGIAGAMSLGSAAAQSLF